MAGIVLLEHDTAGAIEKLGPGFGELPMCLSDFPEHSEREGIAVQRLDFATGEVIEDKFGLYCGELLCQERTRIVSRERLQVEQRRRHTIVVLNLDLVRSAQPVSLTAREDEGRVADLREFFQYVLDRATRCGGGDFVEAIDNNPYLLVALHPRIEGTIETARANVLHTGLLTEHLAEHCFPHSRVAEDHDRRSEGCDFVLADELSPPVGRPVGQGSTYVDWNCARRNEHICGQEAALCIWDCFICNRSMGTLRLPQSSVEGPVAIMDWCASLSSHRAELRP